MKWGVRKKKQTSSRVSARRQRTIEMAKKSGLSDEEAEEYAKRRARVEKLLVAVGVTTIAAAVAYTARSKYVKQYKGEILKSGSEMQRIVTQRRVGQKLEVPGIGESLDKPFYTSFRKDDNLVYKTLLSGGEERFKLTLSPSTDLKVASVDQSQKIFKKLYESDSSFKKAVDKMSFGSEKSKGVDSKKALKKTYALFDHELVKTDEQSRATAKKFYDAMKDAGFDAVYDLNDRDREKITKAPVIVFNNMNKVAVKDVEQYTFSGQLKKSKTSALMQVSMNQISDNQKLARASALGGAFIVKAGMMSKEDTEDYYEDD